MASRAEQAHPGAPPAHGRAGFDWGHLRFFLELARTGSLSAAARRLGVDRNTVARRVAALEAELGVALFERGPQGWVCLEDGRALAQLAERVETNVLALARHADGRDRALEGTVRLTTATHVAVHLLAPAASELHARHPRLVLELAADARTFDLTRREADLALRLGRPRDAGLVTRKLSEVAYAFYAARGTPWARAGEVDFAAGAFIAFDDSLAGAPQERWMARIAPARDVVFRTNSTAGLVAAAHGGVGVALLPRFVADDDPGLVRLDGPPAPPHELWLLVHGELRRTPRVAAVIAWLDAVIERARPALSGVPPPP